MQTTVSTITGLLLATTISTAAVAQTVESIPAETGSAADLSISAWGGVGHTSSGAGFDGTTHFEGFIPLQQTPGRAITFVQPRLLFDNDGNVGGSIMLGHRFYVQESDRVFGGYLAYDHRQTDDNNFSRVGLGLESLGEVWDFFFNAYIPIGNSQQLVDKTRFDTGYNTASGFQGNRLMLSSRREERITRTYEAALFGLDAEIGAKLAEWENGGSLRAFGGLYFYDAAGSDAALGWRLRLEARPTQNVTLGLALQDDDLFGTNVVASINLMFPRVRPEEPIAEEDTVAARLGEPVRREANIAVDTQQESETRVEEAIDPLRNPEEEEPYRFIHVTLGASRGDGTFERPFGTVQEALDATISDGNNIVYVDAGSNPNITAFRIPDRVRVLSQAPNQLIAGLPFPGFPEAPTRLPFSPLINYNDGILVRLPLSSDGRFPRIRDASAADLVTMGDRTILSGFQILNAAGNGVAADVVEDVEIRDNTITNPGERGISLINVTGSVILFDNAISGAQGGIGSGQGLLLRNTTDGAVDVTIQRHELTNNRVGIELDAAGNLAQELDPLQIVSIGDTAIRNSSEQGLLLTGEQSSNQQVLFQQGVIQSSGAEGVYAQVIQVGSQEVTIEDSTISRNGGDGIRGQAGVLDGSSTAAQELFVRRNRILGNGGNGISIEANEVSAQEFAIDRNQIQNNAGDGIQGVVNNVGFQEFVTDANNQSSGISNNTITGNGGQGINLDTNDTGTLIADIKQNRVSGNAIATNPDVEITANSNTSDVCVVLIGNTTVRGIELNNVPTGTPALFEVGDLSTVTVRNQGSVVLHPSLASFTDRSGITSCFRN